MRKTIAYARKMRSQPRQAKSPPHCAAGSTESKVNTTTATPTPEALAIAVIFKDFAIDHTPDGWPAVKQMHLNAAAAELSMDDEFCDHETELYIRPGDRIAQAMLVQVPRCDFEVVEQLTITERGAGGFGSTGAA